MELLWAPWRTQYIESFKDGNKDGETCFVCDAIKYPEESKKRLVVFQTENTIILMNKYPYNAGHLLVCPKQHTENFETLDEKELLDLILCVRKSMNILDKLLKPHGYNVGLNFGRVAGAGLPEHIHFHVIPRWNGDTSFIATISDTKVISQSIDQIFEDLLRLFDDTEADRTR